MFNHYVRVAPPHAMGLVSPAATGDIVIAVPRTAGGFLSLLVQRKETCRGSATHKYTRPQAAQKKSRLKGGFVVQKPGFPLSRE
jgi:hypothetical protein